jgi:predicted GNAT family N-acyltransferase
MNEIVVTRVTTPEERRAIELIRRAVFQVEQGIDPKIEFDGLDESADHVLAYLNQTPVGTARIRYLEDTVAKIERLAVLLEARHRGIGKKLMEKALEVAANKGKTEAVIHAQEYVKRLHEQLGFEVVSDRFYEAGIAHIKMKKSLLG